MKRAVLGKRGAVAAAAVGLALSAGAPAFAAAQPESRAATLTYTINFAHTTSFNPGAAVGGVFVGRGPVTDASGTRVGTAVDQCAIDSVSPGLPPKAEVLCTIVLTLPGGQIELSTVGTIDLNPLDFPYSFNAIVNGGDGTYDGVTGDAKVTATAPGVYSAAISLN